MAKQQLEYQLQKQVCQYLRLQYPNVLFMSDSIAFCHLTMPQAVRNKAVQKEGFKCPDLVILEPRGGHNGLFIELKKESPYLKGGNLSTNAHIQGQAKTIADLKAKGYWACFAWGFDMAKDIIDDYMEQSL